MKDDKIIYLIEMLLLFKKGIVYFGNYELICKQNVTISIENKSRLSLLMKSLYVDNKLWSNRELYQDLYDIISYKSILSFSEFKKFDEIVIELINENNNAQLTNLLIKAKEENYTSYDSQDILEQIDLTFKHIELRKNIFYVHRDLEIVQLSNLIEAFLSIFNNLTWCNGNKNFSIDDQIYPDLRIFKKILSEMFAFEKLTDMNKQVDLFAEFLSCVANYENSTPKSSQFIEVESFFSYFFKVNNDLIDRIILDKTIDNLKHEIIMNKTEIGTNYGFINQDKNDGNIVNTFKNNKLIKDQTIIDNSVHIKKTEPKKDFVLIKWIKFIISLFS